MLVERSDGERSRCAPHQQVYIGTNVNQISSHSVQIFGNCVRKWSPSFRFVVCERSLGKLDGGGKAKAESMWKLKKQPG